MAEFLKVVKERKRMCESYGDPCKGCPLEFAISCKNWMLAHPEETEEIIMEWSEKHPIMTNRKKFEEVFGFDLLKRIVLSEHDKEWFDEEYKESDDNE